MIEVAAKIESMTRKRVSGIGNIKANDDNVICLTVKIHQGPTAWLDRRVRVEIGVSEFVKLLPESVKNNLCNVLTGKEVST